MNGLTDIQAHRASLEIEFQESQWDGCQHLDCVEGCSHWPENWRCERFEQAFTTWLKRRTVCVTSTPREAPRE